MEQVVRSTCDRLIDLIGERVEQRIYNMLYMLYGKFGNELRFTSEEIAELVRNNGRDNNKDLCRPEEPPYYFLRAT